MKTWIIMVLNAFATCFCLCMAWWNLTVAWYPWSYVFAIADIVLGILNAVLFGLLWYRYYNPK